MDKIIIKGLKIFAYHGVNAEETQNGQEFELDLVMYANLSKARKSDALEDTVNYAAVKKAVNAAMCERPFNLIERAADEVARKVLLKFKDVQKIVVELKKPNAPMSGIFDYVAVNITLERSEL